ncbi:acyltransferase, partial [Burkholderia sp.]|uniref:acyltransferase family protein n=4 Tax=Burkholderia sp. TaxID=36773 RepID=UPI00258A140D
RKGCHRPRGLVAATGPENSPQALLLNFAVQPPLSPMTKYAPPSPSQRVFGLDVLRSVAVLLVLACHTVAHGAPPAWLKWYFWAQGTIGVEIFYVLSGFLIGSILIKSYKTGKLRAPCDILDFWKRRWARTLPLYAFFLLVYLRFDYHGPAPLDVAWPFFLFLQNLAWPMAPFFEHSWSLAVEEWFYLLLPCAFLAALTVLRTNGRALLATCTVFLLLPLCARIYFGWHAQSLAEVDRYVRSIVICRLDSLFIGVIAAYVRIERPALFARFAKSWKLPLALFVGLTFYFAFGAPYLASNGFLRVMFFPMLSVVIAALLPAAMQVRTSGSRLFDRFIGWTSKISYSLYLGHICMLTLGLGLFASRGISIDGQLATAALYITLVCLYYAFATLTYTFIEQPYIRLRDRSMGNTDDRSGAVAMTSDKQTAPAEPERVAGYH